VDRLDDKLHRAVELVRDCRGRVIVTGMGKSGIICRKLAATFSSTGTRPSSCTRPRPCTATSA
jgi:arabinose-5-phosphate isomerase